MSATSASMAASSSSSEGEAPSLAAGVALGAAGLALDRGPRAMGTPSARSVRTATRTRARIRVTAATTRRMRGLIGQALWGKGLMGKGSGFFTLPGLCLHVVDLL